MEASVLLCMSAGVLATIVGREDAYLHLSTVYGGSGRRNMTYGGEEEGGEHMWVPGATVYMPRALNIACSNQVWRRRRMLAEQEAWRRVENRV